MHHHRLLPLLALSLVVAGCARTEEAPPPPQQVDEAAVRDTITARERAWSAAFVAGDAAAIADIYTEDGAQVEPVGEWHRGRAAISASMKAQLDTLNVTAREDVPEEIMVFGDYALEIGRYNTTSTTKVGNRNASSAGRYMVLWRKDADGQWRIHRDIGTGGPTP